MSSASAARAKLPASVTAVNTLIPVKTRASKLTNGSRNLGGPAATAANHRGRHPDCCHRHDARRQRHDDYLSS
jgi:hypothetical protein